MGPRDRRRVLGASNSAGLEKTYTNVDNPVGGCVSFKDRLKFFVSDSTNCHQNDFFS